MRPSIIAALAAVSLLSACGGTTHERTVVVNPPAQQSYVTAPPGGQTVVTPQAGQTVIVPPNGVPRVCPGTATSC